MRKYAVNIQSFTALFAGGQYTADQAITLPQNIVEVNMPPNMVVNRVTFQSNATVAAITPAMFVVNVRPPATASDGAVFKGGSGPVTPGRFTFENFNGEEINQTFYVANTDDNNDTANFQVIFEGYER